MTIKPLVNQKTNEKKEEPQNQSIASNVRSRNVISNKTTSESQSPQRRNDIFDEISRHRRSPHKSGGRSRRDHHKREQRDREKVGSSPQYHTALSNCNNMSLSSSSSGELIAIGQGGSGSASSSKSEAEEITGYNSGDEHLVPKETLLTPDEWKNRDEQFVKSMSERGFIIQDIAEDGACLFRAISLQIYGDQEMHEVIRQQTMDYIYQNREYFAHFVTEDINSYVTRKRNKFSHGNHIEIQAMSEIYNRPVELYCYKATPINIFNSEQMNNGYDPLRLSYQRGSHYNAIMDPYNASVGVGLGLAGYKPESQTREAIRLSEQLEIEKTMFEDKLKTTDWEATNEAIEEQIARESYLQWCRDNMQNANAQRVSTNTSTTSSTVTSAEATSNQSSNYNNNSNNMSNNNNNLNTSNVNGNNNLSNSNNHTNQNICGPSSYTESNSKDTMQFHSANNANSCNNNNNNGNVALNIPSLKSGDKLMLGHGSTSKSEQELAAGDCGSTCDTSDDIISSGGSSSTSSSSSGSSSVDQYTRDKLMRLNSTKLSGSAMHKGTTKGQNNCSSICGSSGTSGKSGKRRRRDDINQKSETSNKTSTVAFNENDVNIGISKRLKQQHIQHPNIKESVLIQGDKSNITKSSSTTITSTPTTTTTDSAATSPNDKSHQQLHQNQTKQIKLAYLPGTSKQQSDEDETPVSQFYQSLLESSYADDGLGQLSENEMVLKAIQMSRIDFLEDQKRKFEGRVQFNRNNIEIDDAGDEEDSDTTST